jgi:programmed cell death protein 5
MDELDIIRRKKLEELKQSQFGQMQQQSQEEEQLKQQVQQLEIIVKQAFTKKALERYGNLKAAFPDRAVQLSVILAQAIQSGQITKIDDNTLKEILKKLTPEKKEFNIKRA